MKFLFLIILFLQVIHFGQPSFDLVDDEDAKKGQSGLTKKDPDDLEVERNRNESTGVNEFGKSCDTGSPDCQATKELGIELEAEGIAFGKPCDRGNPDACQHYPIVTCVTDSRRFSTCRCTFFRTWIAEGKTCLLNVFSPCSNGLPGTPELECGKNAHCVNDTLGINKVKFCRCQKGYKPMLNDEYIPAFCVENTNVVESNEAVEDYDHDDAVPIHQSQLLTLSLLPFLHYRA